MRGKLPPPRAARGFILIYVVGMLAVLTGLIILADQSRKAVPRQLERQLQQAVESQQADYLADTLVLMASTSLPKDPRYDRFSNIINNRSLDAAQSAQELALLKAALAQMGFKIDIEPRERPAPGSDAAAAEAVAGEKAGTPESPFPLAPRREPHRILVGEVSYRILVEPGNARPNLNAIPYEPLWRYLVFLKVPEVEAQQLAADLIDWRDIDDFSSEGKGHESDYYRRQVPSYTPRNGPIQSWQELAYVAGVTPDRLGLLRQHFSLGGKLSWATRADYMRADALAALTQIPLERVRRALDWMVRPRTDDEGAREDPSHLLDQDEWDRFEQAVTWDQDRLQVRVTLTSDEARRTLDYDGRSKRVIARW